jgi:adenylate cyclase
VLGDPRLKDKLVFIGSSLAQAGNLRPTAADPLTPSSQIQAAVASQILLTQVPWRPSLAIWIEMAVLALGALSVTLASLWVKPMASAAIAAGSSVLATVFAALAYHGAHLALDPVAPALGIAAAGLASGLSQYSASRRSEASIRKSFEQRLPASVVAQLAKGQGGQRIAGEERVVTALFTDIEGFTAMTSALPPKDLVRLLDGYFEGITRIVIAHGGMLDKIVGDAAHAFFNMPQELAHHETKALNCAQAIARFAEDYRHRPDALKAGFGRTRIGLETGTVLAGDVGAAGKYDYSAHGPAVNLAARLQDANKQTGTAILAGPGIKAANPAGWDLVRVAVLDLRGFGPTEVFEPRQHGLS